MSAVPYGLVPVLPNGEPVPMSAGVTRLPGTPYGLTQVPVPPTLSGAATGGLVAGIGSVLLAFLVGCIGLTAGAGLAIGGAFAVLAGAAGLGAIVLGVVGLRQVSQVGRRFSGRGLAFAGISCGAGGILLTCVSIVAAALRSVG